LSSSSIQQRYGLLLRLALDDSDRRIWRTVANAGHYLAEVAAHPLACRSVSEAFSTGQAKTVGIFVIVVIVLAGVLFSFVFQKLTGRLIVAAIVVGLGIFVWTQRDAIDHDAKKCDAKFLGIHLTPSNKQLKQHCQQIANR
jgi:hypothetical protein